MSRRPHWLKENRKGEMPSHCIWVDTETQPKRIDSVTHEAVLWFGHACYQRRTRGTAWSEPVWQRFTTPAQFWKWVDGFCKDKRRIYIFAHNVSFDFTVLRGFTTLRRRGWKLRKAIIEDPPTVLEFRRALCTIKIIDTLNYFRMSLDQLGKALGVPKLTMPDAASTAESWDTYCANDVEVIRRAMHAFMGCLLAWDAGNFQATLAGQSFAAFRHRFMDARIYIDCNEKALALARASYCGGRVEVFKHGATAERLYVLDINSQYPFIMQTEYLPTQLLSVLARVSHAELADYMERYCVVADVTIKASSAAYPLKHDGRLVFPVGRFRAALTTPELRYALDHGDVDVIHSAALYERAVIFKRYVDFFYTQRMQYRSDGNAPFAFMCKILMNSLYGKFGQRGRIFNEIGEAETDEARVWLEVDAETREVSRFRSIGGVIQRLATEGEAANSHPAIAAHVTASARMLLWRMIATAGRGNVYYVDTDSLTVNADGYRRLTRFIDPDQLGALKLERIADGAIFHGCKDYIMGDVVKIKGVRKNAVEIAPGVYEQDMFIGFKGMLMRGDVNHFRIKRVQKKLAREYQKGYTLDSGDVVPLMLDTNTGG